MITRRMHRRKFGEMEDTENAGDVHNVQTPVANLSQKASPQRQQDVQQGTPAVADQPHPSHGTPPTVCLGHPHNKPAAESLFLRLRPQLHTGARPVYSGPPGGHKDSSQHSGRHNGVPRARQAWRQHQGASLPINGCSHGCMCAWST